MAGGAQARRDPARQQLLRGGGTSLTVFAVVQRLRTTFGLDRGRLPDQALYQFPTVEALAAHIDGLRSGNTSPAPAGNTMLVTLKRGEDPGLPPFLVASAGGTLGAYEKLARVLRTRREIVGVRDPFIWGERDPTMGFEQWVSLYVSAIQQRQPEGPYYIGAYSSAGAFGYEMARQLRRDGREVRLLVLIDPVGMDSLVRPGFGYWALRARYMRPSFRRIVRLGGWLRQATFGWLPNIRPSDGAGGPLSADEFQRRATQARTDKAHILALSALLELNTGLPFTLMDADLSAVAKDQYLSVLLARVKALAPDVDPAAIESIVVQYYLQTRSHRAYRPRRYKGNVVLFEVEGPHIGLVASQLRAYVRGLRAVGVPLGPNRSGLAWWSSASPRRCDHTISACGTIRSWGNWQRRWSHCFADTWARPDSNRRPLAPERRNPADGRQSPPEAE